MFRLRPSRARRLPRLAPWLVWVAVVAHLGLGYFGADHAARMLAAEAGGWSVVCTPNGLERIALNGDEAPSPEDQNPTDTRLTQCLACSAPIVAAPLPGTLAVQFASLEAADRPVSHVTQWHPQARSGLRPPPRAPPALS
jgi:hypothetical protein